VRWITAIVIFLTLACSSPERKAEQARDELASWAATGEVLSQQWSRGKVARPFVKSTLEVAFETVKALADSSGNAAAARRITQLYDSFSRAVENDDHAAAGLLSSKFGTISKALQKPQ